MTTEIEEKFYKAFDIPYQKVAPKKYTDFLVDGIKHKYPQITNKMYLEMIAILNRHVSFRGVGTDSLINGKTLDEVKESILSRSIQVTKGCHGHIYVKIRKLFGLDGSIK